MTLLDQFETNPAQFYTGSYSDDVYVGNINLINTDLSGGFTRQRIAGGANKDINTNIFNKKNLTYNQRLQFFSGSTMPGVSSVKFSQTFSDNEQFFDSFVPNPVDIAKTNGMEFPYLGDSGSLEGSFLHNIPNLGRNAVSLFLGDTQINSFTDTDWTISKWPFRKKYNTLSKIFSLSTKLPNTIQQNINFEGNIITPPSQSNELGSVYFTTERITSFNFPKMFSFISNSAGLEYREILLSASPAITPNILNIKICLSPDANNDNTPIILAACGASQLPTGGRSSIYKSADGNGLIWENVTSTAISAGGPLIGRQLRDFSYSVDSASTNKAFLRWVVIDNLGGIHTCNNRSPILNEEWTFRGSFGAVFNSIAFNDPRGEIALESQNFVAVGNTGLIVTSSSGLGSDWESIDISSKPGTNLLNEISFCSSSQRFVVAGNECIWQSNDNRGSSWAETLTISDYNMTSIAINDTNTVISVGINSSTLQLVIYRSTDGGGSWTQVYASAFQVSGGTTAKITAARIEDDFDWVVVFTRPNTGLFPPISLFYTALLISRNDGVDWETINTVIHGKVAFSIIGTAYNTQTNLFSSLSRYLISFNSTLNSRKGMFRTTDFSSNSYLTVSNENINEIVSLKKGGVKPNITTGFSRINIDVVQFYKTYFGIGDGIKINLSPERPTSQIPERIFLRKKSIDIYDYTVYNPPVLSQKSLETVRIHGVRLRGWGYGLLSAIPTSSKTIWRRGRYGQFRDMLEQRLYSKMYTRTSNLTSGGPTQSPVTVTIVSGSNAALIAENQTTNNPTDSGQFDFEYKAAQPFFDNINIGLNRPNY